MKTEKNLKKATAFIYLGLGLSIPNMIFAYQFDGSFVLLKSQIGFAGVIISLLVGLIWAMFLANQVGRGKRWAAWMYTIMSAFSLLSLGKIVTNFDKNLLYGFLQVSQCGLQYFAVYLINESKIKSMLGFGSSQDHIVRESPPESNVIAIKKPAEVPSQQTPCATPDALTDLGKFHELLKSGAITQEEFDQQKKKILERAA